MKQSAGTSTGGSLQSALRRLEQLQVAMRSGGRTAQVEIVRQLLTLRAPLADQWQNLAAVALNNGEIGLARQAIDLFVEHHGGSAHALYHKATILEQCGDLEGAYALLRSLPQDVPHPATNAYSRGVAAVFAGDAEEARIRLGTATKLRPELGTAWLVLATSSDMAEHPELADRIVAAEPRMRSVHPAQRAAYYHALGKVHADRGEHARAFSAFAQCAAEMKALMPYSAGEDREDALEAVRGHTPGNIAAIAGRQQEPTGDTIFVTGLPRSGTTLVEQILASHSAVGDGAELNRLLLLAGDVGGASGEDLNRYVEANGVADAARLWRHWMRERFPGAGRVVDKSITTTRLLGLAASLLPEAPLVWLIRDPLDCAWSCFRTFFVGTTPWSHDLEDIAAHFRIEDELLRRWQDILGERLLLLPYEALASDPETWIRRLLTHCGLSVEPQVFTPHETMRAVQTASAMQVRRPIDRKGIGSAEPYREFLEPFVKAYSA